MSRQHSPSMYPGRTGGPKYCLSCGSDWPCGGYALEESDARRLSGVTAPRAEGLDAALELMREIVEQDYEWAPPRPDGGRESVLERAATFLETHGYPVSRPSDVRVHTGIDFGVPEGDYTVDLVPSDERVPESEEPR